MITIDGGTGVITSNNKITLPAGSGAPGTVLQVQHDSTTTTSNHTSSTSYIDTTLTDSITPYSTSNNIHVLAVIQWDIQINGGSDGGLGFKLTRTVGGTETTLYESDDPYDVYQYSSSGNQETRAHKTIDFLDTTISTTSAATYKVYARSYNTTQQAVKCQVGNAKSTITLMEIKA